ncbi:uncharacterized protein [Miscanthus floridulus]|uniref:uncharacterized protein n=1 Tax=Miscanthus floridulus TaxID=154761 RepID=UPI0034576AD0
MKNSHPMAFTSAKKASALGSAEEQVDRLLPKGEAFLAEVKAIGCEFFKPPKLQGKASSHFVFQKSPRTLPKFGLTSISPSPSSLSLSFPPDAAAGAPHAPRRSSPSSAAAQACPLRRVLAAAVPNSAPSGAAPTRHPPPSPAPRRVLASTRRPPLRAVDSDTATVTSTVPAPTQRPRIHARRTAAALACTLLLSSPEKLDVPPLDATADLAGEGRLGRYLWPQIHFPTRLPSLAAINMLSVQQTRLLLQVRGCFNCRSMNGHDLHIYHQACESSIPLQSEQHADFRRTRRRLFAASKTENGEFSCFHCRK